MQRKIVFFLTTVALVLLLAACGGKEKEVESNASAPVESASQEVVIKASNWEFDQTEYAVTKDTPVKITLENLSGAHGIEIVGADVKLRGNKSEVVTLPAGTYEIKCNIMCGSGHATMVAKLVVS